jgi:hypothetical protein
VSTETNPYKPLSDSQSGVVEYPFEGTIDKRDIKRLCRSTRFTGVGVGLFGAFLVNAGFDALRFSSPSAGGILITLGMTFVLLGIFLWWWPARLLKANRFLIGPVRGVLKTNELCIESHGSNSRVDADCIQIERVAPYGLGLIITQYRYLPARLFEDFEGAQALAKDLSTTSRRVLPGDDRIKVLVPENLVNCGPAGVVRFAGPILGRDFLTNQVKRRLWTVWFTVIFWIAFICIVGSCAWKITDSKPITAGITFVAAVTVYKRRLQQLVHALRSFRTTSDEKDNVLMSLRGWLDAEGMAAWNALSDTRSMWSSFESYSVKDQDTIVLQRGPGMFVALNRRLFASDEDWNTALSYVAKHVPPA